MNTSTSRPTPAAPLDLVIFGGVVAGVVIGFTWEWLREHKHRKAASLRGREVARLEPGPSRLP